MPVAKWCWESRGRRKCIEGWKKLEQKELNMSFKFSSLGQRCQ
jgi:hypothetical protein